MDAPLREGMDVSEQMRHEAWGRARVFAAGPVAVGWTITVAVDLLFNAGLFAALFEQGREPGLLGDEELFARIPVAYAALLAGVAALAWLLDRLPARGMRAGAIVGAGAGAVTAALGVVALWTAIELTAPFVLAAFAVQVSQFAAAGAVLGGYQVAQSRRRYTVACLSAGLLAVVGAFAAQNVLGGFR